MVAPLSIPVRTFVRLRPGFLVGIRQLLLIAGMLLASAGLSAQDESLLWGIRPPGMAHTSYLFGTLHAVGLHDEIPDYSLAMRMEESGRLLMELVPDWRAEGLIHHALLPDGIKLYHVLSQRDYRRTVRFFRRYGGMDADVLDDYCPAHLALLAGVYLRHEGSYMDFLLADFARLRQLELRGLETVTEQLAPLQSLSYREQAGLLRQILQASKLPEPSTEALLDAYRRADLDSVAALLAQLPSPAYHPVVVHGRNELLYRRIDTALVWGPAMIAVGVANLPGEDGLLARFREAGYDVWPIAPERPVAPPPADKPALIGPPAPMKPAAIQTPEEPGEEG